MIRALLISLALCSIAVSAEQIDVEVAPGAPGKLQLPDGAAPRGAVLLLHGWNSQMDEVGDLYADLAAALAQQGIASLRFDFTGEGPRANFVVTSTRESRILEAEAAYGLLRERVPGVRYGVNGTSLGGLTAMILGQLHPDWFASMALWSAAGAMRLDGDAAYMNAVRTALGDGRSVYSTWTEITLTREFLVSWMGVDATPGMASYPGSLLTIRGTEDYLPSLDAQWLRLTPSEDDAFILIGGADHIFDVLEQPRPDYGARAIGHTVDWFASRL